MTPASAPKTTNSRKTQDKKSIPPVPPTPKDDRNESASHGSTRKAKNGGRKKIKIIPIADDRARQVTFGKRKNGILKKAHELSILCGCDVTIMIFNNKNGKLFEYSNPEPQNVLMRYAQYTGPSERRRSDVPPELDDDPDEDVDDDDDDAEADAEDENENDEEPEAEPESAVVETSEVPVSVTVNKNRDIAFGEPSLASAAIGASAMAGLRHANPEKYVHPPPGRKQVHPNVKVLAVTMPPHQSPIEQSIPTRSSHLTGAYSKPSPPKQQLFSDYPVLESHSNHHFVFPSSSSCALGRAMPVQIGNPSGNQLLHSQSTTPAIHKDNQFLNPSLPVDPRRPLTGHIAKPISKQRSYYESLTSTAHNYNPVAYKSQNSGSGIPLPAKIGNITVTRASEPMLQTSLPRRSLDSLFVPSGDRNQELYSLVEERHLEIEEDAQVSIPAPVWPITVGRFLPNDAQTQAEEPPMVTPWSAFQGAGMHYPWEQLHKNRHLVEQHDVPPPAVFDSGVSGSPPGSSAGAVHGRDSGECANVDRELKRRKLG